MPRKGTKKKQNQKVKGNSNNVNQNNITIKIGTKRRSRKPSAPKQPQQQGSNITVHVAQPLPQHTHPGYHENKPRSAPVAEKVEIPILQLPVNNTPLGTPSPPHNTPVLDRYYHRKDNPLEPASPEVTYGDFYDRRLDNLAPLGQNALKTGKRLSFNTGAPEGVTPAPMYQSQKSSTVATRNLFESSDPVNGFVSMLTKPFETAVAQNPAIAELEDYDTAPNSGFQTPAEATTTALAPSGNIPIPDDLPDLEEVPEDELYNTPQPAQAEQLISNEEEDDANTPDKSKPVDLQPPQQYLFDKIKHGKQKLSTLLNQHTVPEWRSLADDFDIDHNGLTKQQIYEQIIKLTQS
jgi:hypothetical protein